MTENRAIEILKGAVLLEIRGKAFYGKVAEDTGNEAVRQFFQNMANEEQKHIEALGRQFSSLTRNEGFMAEKIFQEADSEAASEVLSEKLAEQISSAGFEAAAISAAMAMEKDAIAYYSSRASETDSAEEKKLYEWLSKWETQHLEMLGRINDTLTRQFWTENQFWPF